MHAPLTRLLYLLMRDHLPTGVVREAIEEASAARGDVSFSAPELLELATRYASDLLAPAEPPTRDETAVKALPPAPPGYKRSALEEVILLFERNPERWFQRGEVDAAVLARSVKESLQVLVREGKLEAQGKTKGRRYRLAGSEFKTSEPDLDDAEEGVRPADSADDAEGGDHDDGRDADALASSAAREHRGSGDDGGESGTSDAATANGASGGAAETPPVAAPDCDDRGIRRTLVSAEIDRVGDFIDAAATDIERFPNGEVFPVEVEREFTIERVKLLEVMAALQNEGRVVVLAPRSQYTRYRSAKVKRPGSESRRHARGGEAAETLGNGKIHLSDKGGERAEEAKSQRDKSIIAAAAALPAAREWVRGAGTFNLQQLRHTFELEPDAGTRLLAALHKEQRIEAVGDPRAQTYRATRTNGNGGGGPASKRPLDSETTLEGRALGAISGGTTLGQVQLKLGVSKDVAQAVLSKLYREGEVRTRVREGAVQYVPVL